MLHDTNIHAETTGAQASGTSARRLGVGVSGLYLSLYMHYGFIAFLPLWLKTTGATPEEIGVLMAIPLILRLLTVAPFSAWVGKRSLVRNAIAITALASSVIVLLLMGQPEHAGRIAIVIAFSIMWDQIPVLTDAYAVMAVRSHKLDFGRLRVWGSIGVVVSNALAGWALGITGVLMLPVMIAAILVTPAVVAFLLPPDRTLAPAEEQQKGRWQDLLGDRGLLLAMFATSLIMGSHGVITSFGAIQWSAQGISTGNIGLLQALSVAAETLAFWFGTKLLGSRDPRWMICASAAAAGLRWAIMATSPTMPVLIAAQLLNGITATGAILGIMLVIATRVPTHLSATAQGMNAVLLGAILAVSTAGSGMLWSRGLGFAYAAMVLLAILAIPFAWPTRKTRGAPATAGANG